MTLTEITESGRKCLPLTIEKGTINGIPVVSVLVDIWKETAFVETDDWSEKVHALRIKLDEDLRTLKALTGGDIQTHNSWTKVFLFRGDTLVLRLVEKTQKSKDGYLLGYALFNSYSDGTILYEPFMGASKKDFHLTVNAIFSQIRKHYKGKR